MAAAGSDTKKISENLDNNPLGPLYSYHQFLQSRKEALLKARANDVKGESKDDLETTEKELKEVDKVASSAFTNYSHALDLQHKDQKLIKQNKKWFLTLIAEFFKLLIWGAGLYFDYYLINAINAPVDTIKYLLLADLVLLGKILKLSDEVADIFGMFGLNKDLVNSAVNTVAAYLPGRRAGTPAGTTSPTGNTEKPSPSAARSEGKKTKPAAKKDEPKEPEPKSEPGEKGNSTPDVKNNSQPQETGLVAGLSGIATPAMVIRLLFYWIIKDFWNLPDRKMLLKLYWCLISFAFKSVAEKHF